VVLIQPSVCLRLRFSHLRNLGFALAWCFKDAAIVCRAALLAHVFFSSSFFAIGPPGLESGDVFMINERDEMFS